MRIISKRFLFLFTLFLCIAAVSIAASPIVPKLQVTYLNVGQGDSILVRTGEKVILIDAGDDRSNPANTVIIPFLKREGIKKIDVAVISHPHRDHFGGFIDLVQNFPIGEFYYSCDFLNASDGETGGGDSQLYQKLHFAIMEKGIPYVQAQMDDKLDWGKNVKVNLFHVAENQVSTLRPRADDAGTTGNASDSLPPDLKVNPNNQSLIFRITAGKISYMFTGDAEKDVEATVVAKFRDQLRATVLKSGHHGSKTSSSSPFLDAMKPDYAVISVGERNSFGHPCQETLDSYTFYKVKTFRTDQDGTVDSYTDGTTIRFTSNQSPLEFTQKPELVSLTQNSATIQWKTNKPSDSQILYGVTEYDLLKGAEHSVTIHTLTLTGLNPSTAYKFHAVSHDSKQPDQMVQLDGTFKTPAGDGQPQPKIVQMVTSKTQLFMKVPFEVVATLSNPAKKAAKNLTFELYHTSMTPDTLLQTQSGLTIGTSGTAKVNLRLDITWIGAVEFVGVLKSGNKILDTCSLSVQILPKLFLVDCAHGNIEYYTGRFAGMKGDLAQNLGFALSSQGKPFTPEALKDVFVVAIPDCEKEFAAEEIRALKDYTAKGGSVMFFCKADYNNTSHPQVLNKVLQGIGTNIRFNDDQAVDYVKGHNIGAPWRFFVLNFPSPIIKGVTKLLTYSACTLLNRKMEGLSATKNLSIVAVGDSDGTDVESDGLNDGWLYASHTPQLPTPIVAIEDLGTGRVACYGEGWYDDRYYTPGQQLQTAEFNRCVVAWLSAAREKKLRNHVESLASLSEVDDPEARAMRYEALRDLIETQVQNDLSEGLVDTVKESFAGMTGDTVEKVKKEIKSNLEFKVLHKEAPKDLMESLKQF